MNNIPFKAQVQFPLAADDLNNMQTEYVKIATALGSVLGGNAILSGCVVSGSTVGNGVVFVNGELLPFSASPYNSNTSLNYVRITETEVKRTTTEGEFVVLKQRVASVSTTVSSVLFRDLKRIDYLADLATKVDKVVEPRNVYNYMQINNQYLRTNNMVCQVDSLSNVQIRGCLFFKNTGQPNEANTWLTLFNLSDASGMNADRIKRIAPQSPWTEYAGVMFVGLQPVEGIVVNEYRFILSKSGDFKLHTEGNTDIFNRAITTQPIYINVMYNNPLSEI